MKKKPITFEYNISSENPLFIGIDETKKQIQSKLEEDEELSEFESNTKKLMSYKLSFRVHWGNYAENQIIDILRKNPEYILWCIQNLEHFAIDNIIFLFPFVRSEAEYYRALELNLVKKAIIEKWQEFEDDDDHTSYRDYDDYDYDEPSYSKYGGAYGYDDDTIDSAFEGDPENYWNID